jgi:hypothetical protein
MRTDDRTPYNDPNPWEPWKALSAAFAAGIAFATGFVALALWILAHFR